MRTVVALLGNTHPKEMVEILSHINAWLVSKTYGVTKFEVGPMSIQIHCEEHDAVGKLLGSWYGLQTGVMPEEMEGSDDVGS